MERRADECQSPGWSGYKSAQTPGRTRSLGGYPSAGSANSSGVSHSQMRLTKDIDIRLFVARHLPAKEYWLLPCLPAAIGGDVIVNDILLLSARNLFMEG